MARLVLFVFLAVALLHAVATLISAQRTTPAHSVVSNEDTMPKTVQKTAYVLLIVLMLGVASGWLGAA